MTTKAHPCSMLDARHVILSVCILMLTHACHAEQRTPSNWLRTCQVEGNIEFECAQAFSEDLAAVAVPSPLYDGKAWGFIDASARMVIAPHFQHVEPFNQGLAVARQDGNWGFINVRGEWVINPQFNSLTSMNQQGVALAINASGELVRVSRDGTQRILLSARLAPRLTANALPEHGQMPVSVQMPTKLWLTNEAKEWPLPESVIDVAPLLAGLIPAAVRLPGGEVHWGLLDSSGQWWAEPTSLRTAESPITDGALMAVARQSQWLLMDRHGNLKNEQLWSSLTPLAGGNWLAEPHGDGPAVVLDASGKVRHVIEGHLYASEVEQLGDGWLIPTKTELLVINANSTFWQVKRLGRDFEIIRNHLFLFPSDTEGDTAQGDVLRPDGTSLLGNEVTPMLRDFVMRPVRNASDPHALALLEPLTAKQAPAWLTTSGRMVSNPEWIDLRLPVEPDSPRIAQARNGKFGTVDEDGRWLIDPVWDGLSDFHGGLALGRKRFADGSQTITLVNISGQALAMPDRAARECAEWWFTSLWCQDARGHHALWLPTDNRWIELGPIERTHQGAHGLQFARQGGLWGLLDPQYGWRIPPSETERDDITILDRRIAWRTPHDNTVHGDRIYSLGTGNVVRSEDGMQLERLADNRYLLRSQMRGTSLIDGEGRTLLHSVSPHELRQIGADSVALFMGTRYGLIDTEGRWVHEPHYRELPHEWSSQQPARLQSVAMKAGQLQWRDPAGRILAIMGMRQGKLSIVDAKGQVTWGHRGD